MDLVSLVRTLGGLGMVLGLLAGALWLVRRYDLRLPGRTGTMRDSRLELIEKLPIDARRCVALLRRDGREHLVLIAPEGNLIVESGFVRDAADLAAEQARRDARAQLVAERDTDRAALAESFGALVDRVRARAARALNEPLLTEPPPIELPPIELPPIELPPIELPPSAPAPIESSPVADETAPPVKPVRRTRAAAKVKRDA
jgi:hypothetical protein